MRSRAHIKGHPLHAILVPFPIAFLNGAFMLDLLRLLTGKTAFEEAAVYATAGGIIFGALAAVPGIIDYIYSVPPGSSGSKRGMRHGMINGTVLMLFTLILLIRVKSDVPLLLLLGGEAIGVILLTVAGWMGGTLLVRNQIGVDHRYAGAGKWHEETSVAVNGRVELKETESLKLNQMKLLRVGDKRIVLGRTDTGLVAFDDACTHRGGSLADGVLICDTVQCPWHGSQFNVQSGELKAGPAGTRINTYRVISEGGTSWLILL